MWCPSTARPHDTVRQLNDTLSHIHLDPLGGISGDMFQAALLDAWPEARGGLEAAMRAAGLPADWQLRVSDHGDGTFTGTRLEIEPPAAGRSRPTGAFGKIRQLIQDADLDPAVAARAVAILTLLAEAEGEVHGLDPEAVHFHELADWDSIADVVGAAYLIERLGARSWSTAVLPLGGGRIRTAHGPMPVPAPATVKLLRGFPVIDDGVPGERVTPTGAAILKSLAPEFKMPSRPMVLRAEGTGFGSRRLAGISNALRVLGLSEAEAAAVAGQVGVISFEIDDQTPEDLAVGLERLRQGAGVLDVLQAPAFGKKGRMASRIQVLCRPDSVAKIIELCFGETTTIGLRWRIEARAILARESRHVETPAGEVTVKVVNRPGHGATAKADIDDVKASSGGAKERGRRRRQAEAAALEENGDG